MPGIDTDDIAHSLKEALFTEWRRLLAYCEPREIEEVADIEPAAMRDLTVVDKRLFTFTAEGVANGAPERRPGARHALLLFATGEDFDDALARAGDFALSEGWMDIAFERGGELTATETIEDDQLRSAAESAVEYGEAMLVYADEIPPDAWAGRG